MPTHNRSNALGDVRAADRKIELLVSTRKGLFVLRGPRDGPLNLVSRQFSGQTIEYATRDPRSRRYFASVTHGQFGPHVYFASDPTGSWEESDGPSFPPGGGASVERTWIIEPGVEEGVLWAGTAPAALFRSADSGRSWQLNQPLWDVPSRTRWQGGAGGLCLHSICPYPSDPRRLAVGISAAGVWLTEDGGESWRRGVHGLVPRYLPEEARQDAFDLCVHCMRRAPREPNTLYMQFHGGIYRSDDGGEIWMDIGEQGGQLPSDFGFPLVLDPHDPRRAFVLPLQSDMDRVTPEGRVRVFQTRDRGTTWEALSKGLPQENAHLTVLRQAFCEDGRSPLGLYFGAESGELFGSADDGLTWRTLAQRLPPILAVRCCA